MRLTRKIRHRRRSLLDRLQWGPTVYVGISALSLAIFVGFYAIFNSWRFVVGLCSILLIHELGHVIAAARRRIPVSPPVFIPFLGAILFWLKEPDTAADEGILALGGPAAGLLACGGFWAAGLLLPSPLLIEVANTGFAMHLYNLLPVPPLDGGRMLRAVSPWVLWIFLPGLLFLAVRSLRSSMAVVVTWAWEETKSKTPETYYQLPGLARGLFLAAYFVLLGSSLVGLLLTQTPGSPSPAFLREFIPSGGAAVVTVLIGMWAIYNRYETLLPPWPWLRNWWDVHLAVRPKDRNPVP